MQKVLKIWFVSFILLTLVSGFVYIIVQQAYRHLADEPQLQMAHDTAFALSNNQPVTTSKTINLISQYLPFTIIYDVNGKVLASEAKLNGKTPVLPSGVLDSAKNSGEDRFTWQPQQGVRLATVIVPYSNGYVLVGRSLYQTEKWEDELIQMVALFWVVSNVIMFAVITVVMFKKK